MIERLSAASGTDVSRETFDKLQHFEALLLDESARQNLISKSSIADLWTRHFLDAAQLLNFAETPGTWCDVGSGAGLPGLVIAILSGQPVTLIEPRRLRADFLQRAAAQLQLSDVEVVVAKAQAATGSFDYIAARAVAHLDPLFAMTIHLAHGGTRFILPKGQSANSELEAARRSWQGSFRLVPSQTNPDAAIVVADGVRPRMKS